MTDKPQDEKVSELTIESEIRGGQQLPPALGANYFQISRIATEVHLLVGTIDPLQVHLATKGQIPPKVTADVTHRFLLSSFGFWQLKRIVDEMAPTVPPLGRGIEIPQGGSK
jgi:hypothetical protein